MTDAEKETLEQYLKDRSDARRFGAVEAAIRFLLVENARLRADRDRFQAIVHAVSPYLDPAALGLTPEAAREKFRSLLAENERLRIESGSQEIRAQDGWDRIEAALAKALQIIESLEPDDIEIDHLESVVKALKGGDDE